jgi:hypothetical protein
MPERTGKRRARYSHALADAARAQRREEGERRNAAYAALTPAEKLARLDAAGLRASRVRAKLIFGGTQ